jgi:hypothetical protein
VWFHERKVELFQDVILRETLRMGMGMGCRAIELEGFRFALLAAKSDLMAHTGCCSLPQIVPDFD